MPDAQRAEIAKLEALHAEHPQGRIFTHLAEAYRKAGELGRAREVLVQGIQRHPDYSSAHVVLARVLLDLGDREQAQTEFQRVLDLDPHNLVALRALGDLAREDGRPELALDYYGRLLDVEPADEDVRRRVGELSAAAAAEPGEARAAAPEETRAAAPEGSGAAAPEEAGAAEPGEAGAEEPEPAGPETVPWGGGEGSGEWGLDETLSGEAADDTRAAIPGELAGTPSAPGEPGVEPPEEDAAELDPSWLLDPAGGEVRRERPWGEDEEPVEPGQPGEPEEPVADEPVAEEPLAEELPAVEEPGPAEPRLEEPVVLAAAADELVHGRPPVEEAAGGDPVIEEPPAEDVLDRLSAAGDEEPAAGEAASTETVEAFGWTGTLQGPVIDEDGEPAPAADTGEPELATETIAQVYARQGLYDRAAEVYRQLLRQRPADDRLRSRLEEMEALADAPAPGSEPGPAGPGGALEGLETSEVGAAAPEVAPLEGLEAQEVDPETGLAAVGGPPAIEPVADLEAEDVPPPPEEEEEEPDGPWVAEVVGEEDAAAGADDLPWLDPEPEDEAAVESVWTGADGATRAEDSPYAWAETESDADESPPIAEYFRGLLDWAPDRGAEGAAPSAGAGAEEAGGLPRAGAGGSADAGGAGGAAGSPGSPDTGRSPGESSDDDDLDVFRSWLESLKQ